MTDLIFPPAARITSQRWDIVGNAAVSRSIFTGATNTVSRTGDHVRIAVNTANTNNKESYAVRAALQSLRANLRGQTNRIWIGDPSYSPRGSFPATELFLNNAFASSTASWSSNNITLVAADRSMRMTMTGGSGVANVYQGLVFPTQYAPYVFRVMLADGKGGHLAAGHFGTYIQDSSFNALNSVTSANGMNILSEVTEGGGSANQFVIHPISGAYPTNVIAGDYIDLLWTSMSRCPLIDNGPNLLIRSDEFDNAIWNKNKCTCGTNVISAPDGNTTADSLIEDNTSGAHYFYQDVTISSGNADYAFSVAAKASTRNFIELQITENTGSTSISQYFNINTGAVGASGSSGANWSNRRAFISNIGNGWYVCTIVGRKTNAAVSLRVLAIAATSDGTDTYVGGSVTASYFWRATLSQSSVPTRLVQTTSAAVAATPQTGNALYVKGLPASTSGLLLPGDRIQFGNQFNIVTASLDSDAAGLGYLQFAIPIRTSPNDNDPVIINNPMARCILVDNPGGWDDRVGGFSDFSFTFEESLDQ